MLLKPLDVVVSVMASVLDDARWTIAQMASYLGMDHAQVFRAARNASIARLLVADKQASIAPYRPHRAALLELLVHGLKYVMVPARGQITRGMPTAHAAPALASHFAATEGPIPVWPTPNGKVRGESFEPVHRCVPDAAARNSRFYEAMSLIDAIRAGRARERSIADKRLREVIGGKHD